MEDIMAIRIPCKKCGYEDVTFKAYLIEIKSKNLIGFLLECTNCETEHTLDIKKLVKGWPKYFENLKSYI